MGRLVIAGTELFCSQPCYVMSGTMQSPTYHPLPARPRNQVLDLLLGRAVCDHCQCNLEDLAREA